MATVKGFIEEPDATLLIHLTKDQLLELAAHYQITLSYDSRRRKYAIMSALTAGLVEMGVLSKLDRPLEDPPEDSEEEETPIGGGSPAPSPKFPEHSKWEHDFKMQELQVRRDELACRREELKLHYCN